MEKIKQVITSKPFLCTVAAIAVAAILFVVIGALTGDPDDAAPTTPAGDVTYTVQIVTNGGKALEGVDVFIYGDSALSDMVAVAKTNAEGIATFTAPSKVYSAVLQNVPAGYPLDASYPILNASTQIVLKATLITEPDLTKDTFGRDDVMFDFTVTDTEGNVYTLSELLKQKRAVVLNFWFSNCDPCKAEFPHLQEAYDKYSDKIALIAVNPVDDAATVAQFRTQQGLTMPMASVDASWEKAFGITGYPTTLVIDRLGNINLSYMGSVPSAELFENVFKYYGAEKYAQHYGLALEDFAAASEEGSQLNPLSFGGVTEFEVTVEPGKQLYADVYKVNGMLLTVEDESVSILYEEKVYNPENGVVSFPVFCPDTYTPIHLVFTNTGTETKTYKVALTFPLGTQGNPITMELGSVSVDVIAGNDQGVYYTYIAQEDGELTLKLTGATEGVEYTYTLYNLNTGAYKTLDADGKAGALSVLMNKGDEVQFTAGSLPDENNEYPAAKLDFTASFKEMEVDIPHITPVDPLPTEPEVTDPTTTEPTTPAVTEPQATTPQDNLPAFGAYTDIYDGEIRAYHAAEGKKDMRLNTGELTYFLFTPDSAGQFRFTTGKGTIAYYGTNLQYVYEQTSALEGATDTSFVVNVKESNLGASYLVAVTAPAGVSSGSLEIKRVGEPILGWEDKPYEVYNGTHTPVKFTAPTGTLKYIDVGKKVTVECIDGYYYLNGKQLYLNLTAGAYTEFSFAAKLVEGSEYPFIRGTVTDANGEKIAKEEYTELVKKYIECADDGLYPLTEDLARILKTQNDSWYMYLLNVKANTKKDMAWLCNVCYVE